MADVSTIQLDKEIIESLKEVREYPRQTYNELIKKMVGVYKNVKKRNQYDELFEEYDNVVISGITSNISMKSILRIYAELLKRYGPQGWWPLTELDNSAALNITKSGSHKGYHPGDYSYPRTKAQQFEICIGAILAQNVSWPNVERALVNLKRLNALSPGALLKLRPASLRQSIRPAGFYNQKAKKLVEFSKFFLSLSRRVPSREELLRVWGVGNETADSMLLYGFKIPSFVIDAYTRRIFVSLGLIDEKAGYDGIKAVFEASLKPDIIVYQEYHALIVEHAKRYYSGKLSD